MLSTSIATTSTTEGDLWAIAPSVINYFTMATKSNSLHVQATRGIGYREMCGGAKVDRGACKEELPRSQRRETQFPTLEEHYGSLTNKATPMEMLWELREQGNTWETLWKPEKRNMELQNEAWKPMYDETSKERAWELGNKETLGEHAWESMNDETTREQTWEQQE